MPDEFDLEAFLPYLLNQAAEASSLEFQRIYKARYGLLRNDWRVLFHLGLLGDMTAREISARARMHKTKISRAVQRLQDRRLIVRKRDEQDRRVEHLALTRQGQDAYRELQDIARQYDARLVRNMADNDVLLLRQMLRQLAGRWPEN